MRLGCAPPGVSNTRELGVNAARAYVRASAQAAGSRPAGSLSRRQDSPRTIAWRVRPYAVEPAIGEVRDGGMHLAEVGHGLQRGCPRPYMVMNRGACYASVRAWRLAVARGWLVSSPIGPPLFWLFARASTLAGDLTFSRAIRRVGVEQRADGRAVRGRQPDRLRQPHAPPCSARITVVTLHPRRPRPAAATTCGPPAAGTGPGRTRRAPPGGPSPEHPSELADQVADLEHPRVSHALVGPRASAGADPVT